MSGGDPGWRNAFEAWTKDPGANQSRCAEPQQTVSESRRTEEIIYSQRGERLSSFPFEHGKTAPFVILTCWYRTCPGKTIPRMARAASWAPSSNWGESPLSIMQGKRRQHPRTRCFAWALQENRSKCARRGGKRQPFQNHGCGRVSLSLLLQLRCTLYE